MKRWKKYQIKKCGYWKNGIVSLWFVELAFFNNEEKNWNVKSRNVVSGEMKLYACDFLILATSENNKGHIPKVGGLENFQGGKFILVIINLVKIWT